MIARFRRWSTCPVSTTLDAKPMADVDGSIPLFQGHASFGLNIGTVESASIHTITYRVRAEQSIASTADLPVQATISTREMLAPTSAAAPRPTSLGQLAEQIGRLPGIQAADPLVFVDMATGSISTHGTDVPGPTKLFVFDAKYQKNYPSIKILSGGFQPGEVLISEETARTLAVGIGENVTLTLPGTAPPLTLRVSGIMDLSSAKPLFESRQAGSLETFQYVPYTMVVSDDIFRRRIAPAFEEAAAGQGAQVGSLPVEELDLLVDRSILNADPATAVTETQGLAAAVLRTASGQDYLDRQHLEHASGGRRRRRDREADVRVPRAARGDPRGHPYGLRGHPAGFISASRERPPSGSWRESWPPVVPSFAPNVRHRGDRSAPRHSDGIRIGARPAGEVGTSSRHQPERWCDPR